VRGKKTSRNNKLALEAGVPKPNSYLNLQEGGSCLGGRARPDPTNVGSLARRQGGTYRVRDKALGGDEEM